MKVNFPDSFAFGLAASDFQMAGHSLADGGGLSIQDAYFPGSGDGKGDEACDWYQRYPEDLKLLREFGVKHLRTSISWARVCPDGKTVNQAGVDHYSRVVDAMLEKHVTPWLTAYHWELPSALQEKGGWLSRETAFRFADYVDVITKRLGDRVKHWMPINEPNIHTFMAHLEGKFAPGIKSRVTGLKAAHHLLLAHGLAMQVIRQNVENSSAGMVLHVLPVERLNDSKSPLAYLGAWYWWMLATRWYLEPLLFGRYPLAARVVYGAVLPTIGAGSVIKEGDMKIISQPMDFLGVNSYFRQLIDSWGQWNQNVPGLERTAMGWEVNPDAFYRMLVRLKESYPTLPPIIITECGAAYKDELVDGQVADVARINFLTGYLKDCYQAIQAGVQLKGFFGWTLMDNLEWPDHKVGEVRFGSIFADEKDNLRRVPKQSLHWYRDVIANRGF